MTAASRIFRKLTNIEIPENKWRVVSKVIVTPEKRIELIMTAESDE